MPYFVYVLRSEEGYHYTGQTQDLTMRLARHDLGTTHYTKQGTGWKVIHTEEYPTRSEAMRREKWLKSGIGREWLKTNIAGWSPSGNDETFGPPKAE